MNKIKNLYKEVMVMPMDVSDRRVQKTRQLLKDALVSLVKEKGFEPVKVQDILERANVGRSTFYFHFESKYELLHCCFEDFTSLFDDMESPGAKRAGAIGGGFIPDLFRIVEKNHGLFKALLGKNGFAMFNEHMETIITDYIGEALKKTAPAMQAFPQPDMLTHYIAYAIIGVLKWWIDNDMPCSVEEMVRNFRQIAPFDYTGLLA